MWSSFPAAAWSVTPSQPWFAGADPTLEGGFLHQFTPQEMAVARLIDDGYTYDEIGERLGISPRTAKAYTDRLRLALGVRKKREVPRQMRLLGLL